MKIIIRQEKRADYQAVFELIEKAFKNEEFSNHKEQFLVKSLRDSEAFIPELSLIAEFNNEIVGYILLTKIKINNNKQSFNSLALAPVSVIPEFQRQGIGRMLIEFAHNRAKKQGHESVILLGHKSLYPKFGYLQADKFGIKLPFDVPKENCMVIELIENGLKGVKGIVEYSKEFYE